MGKLSANIDEKVVITLVDALQNQRDRLLIKIFYESACKTKEISELKVGNILKDSIKIGGRNVSVSKELCEEVKKFALEEGLSDENYLLLGRQSKKITTKRIRQIVQDSSEKVLGFKISPEDLRKASICKKLNENSVDIVRKEAGLKRLDKRKLISSEAIKKIRNSIKNKRDLFLFSLLVHGIKSKRLTQLKVRDISKLYLEEPLAKKIKKFAERNELAGDDFLFSTRQNSSLTKERIFQIITKIGNAAGIEVSPRILNNSAIAAAIANSDEIKFEELGLKTRSFYLHGGFLNYGKNN